MFAVRYLALFVCFQRLPLSLHCCISRSAQISALSVTRNKAFMMNTVLRTCTYKCQGCLYWLFILRQTLVRVRLPLYAFSWSAASTISHWPWTILLMQVVFTYPAVVMLKCCIVCLSYTCYFFWRWLLSVGILLVGGALYSCVKNHLPCDHRQL